MDDKRIKLNPVDLSYRPEHVEALMAENDKLIAENARLRTSLDAAYERAALVAVKFYEPDIARAIRQLKTENTNG